MAHVQQFVMINPISQHGTTSSLAEGEHIVGTYLHGVLQEDNGYDAFSFVGEAPIYTGIYPAKIVGTNKDATLYLWVVDKFGARGLVVANNDFDAVKEYAKKAYEERRKIL